MTKMKLAARNTNAEAAIDNGDAKLAQIERAKSKIQEEINEMSTNLDQAQVADAAMERKAKQFNKTISRYKGKLDHLFFDLDVSPEHWTQFSLSDSTCDDGIGVFYNIHPIDSQRQAKKTRRKEGNIFIDFI